MEIESHPNLSQAMEINCRPIQGSRSRDRQGKIWRLSMALGHRCAAVTVTTGGTGARLKHKDPQGPTRYRESVNSIPSFQLDSIRESSHGFCFSDMGSMISCCRGSLENQEFLMQRPLNVPQSLMMKEVFSSYPFSHG